MLRSGDVKKEGKFVDALLAAHVASKRIVEAMITHVYSIHDNITKSDIAILASKFIAHGRWASRDSGRLFGLLFADSRLGGGSIGEASARLLSDGAIAGRKSGRRWAILIFVSFIFLVIVVLLVSLDDASVELYSFSLASVGLCLGRIDARVGGRGARLAVAHRWRFQLQTIEDARTLGSIGGIRFAQIQWILSVFRRCGHRAFLLSANLSRIADIWQIRMIVGGESWHQFRMISDAGGHSLVGDDLGVFGKEIRLELLELLMFLGGIIGEIVSTHRISSHHPRVREGHRRMPVLQRLQRVHRNLLRDCH